ncbi:MAG: cell division protein FtsA [Lentisphaerae bacterium]|nr:cell division protein FtsA [Lentisphaerota bacterium]
MGAEPFIVLEIGTSKICAIAAKLNQNNSFDVIGVSNEPACGIRKGEIINLDLVSESLKHVIQNLEECAGISIGSVDITFSGAHIQSTPRQGVIQILDVEHGVTQDDMNLAVNAAMAGRLPEDRIILQPIVQQYKVDNQNGVSNPKKMLGSMLTVDLLMLHAKANSIFNINTTLENLGIDVTDYHFNAMSSAYSVVTAEQKKCGVLVIDIGAGTTDFVVYVDQRVVTTGVLAVGGDHVTNDIVSAFTISQKSAEQLKCQSGSALTDSSTQLEKISVPAGMGFRACSIPLSDLNIVINARMDELFRMIQDELGKDLLLSLGAGVVLTGGGAKLKNVTRCAERIMGLPCSVGTPFSISGLTSAYQSPEFASPIGMLYYSSQNVPGNEGLIRKFFKWVKAL